MSAVAALNNRDAGALNAVKERFIRLPSKTAYPRFRDLATGIEQGDGAILVDYYRKLGGGSWNQDYLLSSLDWAYDETFRPGESAVIRGEHGSSLNLWVAPEMKSSGNKVAAEDVSPFMEFMCRLFPNESEREYFLWWIAHVVRRPSHRIIATPVLRSEHGVGKGFIVETLLAGLVGINSVAVCRPSDIVGDFNDIVEGKTVLLIDEVDSVSRKAMGELKSITGNGRITLRRKQKPVINVDNYVSFIIASNFSNAIEPEHGDRRFWIPEYIKHTTSLTETDRFINDMLKPWLLGDGMQLVRDYLEGIDLSAYRASSAPPMTDSKRELLEDGDDGFENLVDGLVADCKVITVEMVMQESERQSIETNTKAISAALKKLGCEQKRCKKKRYYITPAGFKAGLSASSAPSRLEQELQQNGQG